MLRALGKLENADRFPHNSAQPERMRTMRKTTRWTAAGVLVAGAMLGSTAGTAHAEPSSLFAPSALVLTTAHGENAATATPERRSCLMACRPKALRLRG